MEDGLGRGGSLDEDVIHVDGNQDLPSHSEKSHNRFEDLGEDPRTTLEAKGKDLPFKEGPQPLKPQKLLEGLVNGNVKESILQVHTTEVGILLDPVTNLPKALHAKLVLLNRFVELLKVQDWPKLARTAALATAK